LIGYEDCSVFALDLRPNHANTYNNRGHCLAALGDAQGASVDFQTALHLAGCSREATEEALSGLEALARNTAM
jgi:Tfp pilus assembly protein PilF